MASDADARTKQPALEDRKAVVTGGAVRIGRAIAVLPTSYGVDVFGAISRSAYTARRRNRGRAMAQQPTIASRVTPKA